MSLPLEDIRHDFFHALDHFPSDLVRTLWLLQSIDTQLNGCYYNTGKIGNIETSKYVEYLQLQLRRQSISLLRSVQYQKNILNREKIQLSKQLHTRKRYQSFIKKINEQKPTVNIHADDNSYEVKVAIRTPENKNLEPRYCICNDVSYGDMIACDNEDCPKQWFHYKCIHISIPPKGKWYCSIECKINDNKNKNKKNNCNSSITRRLKKMNNRQVLKITKQTEKTQISQKGRGRGRRKKEEYTKHV